MSQLKQSSKRRCLSLSLSAFFVCLFVFLFRFSICHETHFRKGNLLSSDPDSNVNLIQSSRESFTDTIRMLG